MNEFLEEVKEMTEEDILLAFEQPELYSNEELEILRKELKNRGASTDEIRKSVNTQTSNKKKKNDFDINNSKTINQEVSFNSYINNNSQIENNIFWTKFSRSMATIDLICSVIIALFVLVSFCENGGKSVGIGIAISIGIILIAMLSIAGIMVFVEISENINRIVNKMSSNNK